MTTQGVLSDASSIADRIITTAAVRNDVSTEYTPFIDASISTVDDEATTNQAATDMSTRESITSPEPTPAIKQITVTATSVITTSTGDDASTAAGMDSTETTRSSSSTVKTDDITSNLLRESTATNDVSLSNDDSISTAGVTNVDGFATAGADVSKTTSGSSTSTEVDEITSHLLRESTTANDVSLSTDDSISTAGVAMQDGTTASTIIAQTAELTLHLQTLASADSPVASFPTTKDSTSSLIKFSTLTDVTEFPDETTGRPVIATTDLTTTTEVSEHVMESTVNLQSTNRATEPTDTIALTVPSTEITFEVMRDSTTDATDITDTIR